MSQLRRRSDLQWRQEGILKHLSGSDNKYLRRRKNGPGTFEKNWKGFVSLKRKKTQYLIQDLQMYLPQAEWTALMRSQGQLSMVLWITFNGSWRTPPWQDLLGTIVDMLFTESKCEKEGGARLSWGNWSQTSETNTNSRGWRTREKMALRARVWSLCSGWKAPGQKGETLALWLCCCHLNPKYHLHLKPHNFTVHSGPQIVLPKEHQAMSGASHSRTCYQQSTKKCRKVKAEIQRDGFFFPTR